MQDNKQEKMSRDEIIKYVDILIQENEKSYDKRLVPLLYEFFLRANEKFEWSRQEFLEKYGSFRQIVKRIRIRNFKFAGNFSFKPKLFKGEIWISKQEIKMLGKNLTNENINSIINTMFHECLHGTDYLIKDDEVIKCGFYEIENGSKKDFKRNERNTIFYEYANEISSRIISSDEPMYRDDYATRVGNIEGYSGLNTPGSIICATFDMTEMQLAKLKDEGREAFTRYLEEKFPYLDTDMDMILAGFEDNLNVIYNATESKDKVNTSLGLQNIVNTALSVISTRMSCIFFEKIDAKEALERIYYSIYKVQKLIEMIDFEYNLDSDEEEVYDFEMFHKVEELLNRVRLYKRFLDNKSRFTDKEIDKIYEHVARSEVFEEDKEQSIELIKSKFEEDYQDEEYDIEAIVKKYYVQSNEPLNDNTKLIEQVKNSFRTPTIKERFSKAIERIKKPKKAFPVLAQANRNEKTDFKNRIKCDTPIINNIESQPKPVRDNKDERDI